MNRVERRFGAMHRTIILAVCVGAAVVLMILTPAMSQEVAPAAPETSDVATSPPDATGQDASALDVPIPRPVSEEWKRFSRLPLWEDGLSEMSYYDASCLFYGQRRKYTRVHLMNRQFMDSYLHIKASDATDENKIRPAFKMIISEEVPTENYNYRFLTSVFVERPSLEPLKVTVSSQDWCGTSFKRLTWARHEDLDPQRWWSDIMSMSYFPGEGDWVDSRPPNVDPYEAVFLFARAVVASGGEHRLMRLFRSLRSNRSAGLDAVDAVLKPEGAPRRITVPLGSFDAQRVVVDWSGELTWLDVEAAAPYRVLAFRAGDVEGQLRYVERGPYWDRSWQSGFYKHNRAP